MKAVHKDRIVTEFGLVFLMVSVGTTKKSHGLGQGSLRSSFVLPWTIRKPRLT